METSETRKSGTVVKEDHWEGHWEHYIRTDTGEELSLAQTDCVGFGGKFPPSGARVTCATMTDSTTGNRRAIDVEPESVKADEASGDNADSVADEPESFAGPERHTPEDDIQVKCEAAEDLKVKEKPGPANTAQKRQLQVFTAEDGTCWAADVTTAPLQEALDESVDENSSDVARCVGVFSKPRGAFGFILNEETNNDVFVMPGCCSGFGFAFPDVGTRVSFVMVEDGKDGRMRAEDVRPLDDQPSSRYSGTLAWDLGKYGFIMLEDESTMFVLPGSCAGFGRVFPPIGTHVSFNVVTDAKTGKPRADDVRPAQ